MDKKLLNTVYLDDLGLKKKRFKNVTSYFLDDACCLRVVKEKNNKHIFFIDKSLAYLKLPDNYTIKEFENLCKGLRVNIKFKNISITTTKSSPGHYGC